MGKRNSSFISSQAIWSVGKEFGPRKGNRRARLVLWTKARVREEGQFWICSVRCVLWLPSGPSLRNSCQIPREKKAIIQRKLNKELLPQEAQQGIDNRQLCRAWRKKIPYFTTENLTNIQRLERGVRKGNRGQHHALPVEEEGGQIK